ncbi:MAG: two-component sensor histidine kinase [Lachnospiraceae bacterium]|nr:two-component sensor histidine kinase [Lachnospiraceae bacterium]
MKKKINLQMMYIAALAILATLLTLVGVFYTLFKQEIFDELRAYATILQEADFEKMIHNKTFTSEADGLRITVVSGDGTVLFDNVAEETQMTNHSERSEIADAMKSGKGQAVRTSETLSESMYYYAVKTESGNILRVAKQASSAWYMLFRSLPMLILIFILLLLLCSVLSRTLAKSIVAPIEKMAEDMDHMDRVEGYPELEPLIQKIHQQHEDILKSANMRQEFTANVSHELKTPLTSISGYSELIENGMVNEADAMRFGKEIHRSANRLLTLINDIIRLSELDSSSEPDTFEQVDLYELAQTCVEMLQMNAEKHGVSLEFSGEKSVVYGSRQMLDEVIFNLCDNAIRYNKENGKVYVSVGEEDDNVYLSVRDTGIGIDEEYRERIFERFYRVDKSRSKETGGTGLGLAIVKHIVALHHAELRLDSEVGVGTEIRIVFI